MPIRTCQFLALLCCLCLQSLTAKEDVYLEPTLFIEQSFESAPEAKVLWLTKDTKAAIKKVFGKDYPGLRIRYWQSGKRTAWILEEIGKVKPITTGFVIENDVMLSMQVLIYRESHGWEVRYPFFTDQFSGLELEKGKRLNKKIDGISGATLSVNALTRLSKLALFLHKEVTE
ncbi:FMN-binding protein [Coraliomargarita akajimensis]|uniref:FMN-binding domain protein n=1 Tax=Coraliomargarita akajimensis (strain DSM 45221 / IAM 15411 / JCM 23193 / KCTC 12865 / 04OKA010-24) TaxID=583355 RepID=D5EK96_CORAD|nr:FMN-binding protein [Coraliomargarita akajimensis]ADE54845.1 FMN-binding domain protein [Coraliomargarita akajimensis DSM 45221]